MAIHLQCDYCGQPIDDDYFVKISALGREAEGHGSAWGIVNEYLGHFHSNSERNCYSDLWEQMRLVLDTHSSLEDIPTADDRPKSAQPTPAPDSRSKDWGEACREAKRVWEGADREALALRVLADERLTISEAATRINHELGYPGRLSSPPAYTSYVRYLLNRMLDAGKVERVPEAFQNKLRYRYFRNVADDGSEAVA